MLQVVVTNGRSSFAILSYSKIEWLRNAVVGFVGESDAASQN